eukprot:12743124-Alexandrium_andersonii.AAC.1
MLLRSHHGSSPPRASMYNQPVKAMVWVCACGAQNWASRQKCRACKASNRPDFKAKEDRAHKDRVNQMRGRFSGRRGRGNG